MKKEIVINASANEIRVAITEDGRLAELFLEVPDKERHVGSIYLGKVQRVVQGMNAAFVDIGESQDAFLHFSDASNVNEDYKDLIDEKDDLDVDDDDDIEPAERPAREPQAGARDGKRSERRPEGESRKAPAQGRGERERRGEDRREGERRAEGERRGEERREGERRGEERRGGESRGEERREGERREGERREGERREGERRGEERREGERRGERRDRGERRGDERHEGERRDDEQRGERRHDERRGERREDGRRGGNRPGGRHGERRTEPSDIEGQPIPEGEVAPQNRTEETERRDERAGRDRRDGRRGDRRREGPERGPVEGAAPRRADEAQEEHLPSLDESYSEEDADVGDFAEGGEPGEHPDDAPQGERKRKRRRGRRGRGRNRRNGEHQDQTEGAETEIDAEGAQAGPIEHDEDERGGQEAPPGESQERQSRDERRGDERGREDRRDRRDGRREGRRDDRRDGRRHEGPRGDQPSEMPGEPRHDELRGERRDERREQSGEEMIEGHRPGYEERTESAERPEREGGRPTRDNERRREHGGRQREQHGQRRDDRGRRESPDRQQPQETRGETRPGEENEPRRDRESEEPRLRYEGEPGQEREPREARRHNEEPESREEREPRREDVRREERARYESREQREARQPRQEREPRQERTGNERRDRERGQERDRYRPAPGEADAARREEPTQSDRPSKMPSLFERPEGTERADAAQPPLPIEGERPTGQSGEDRGERERTPRDRRSGRGRDSRRREGAERPEAGETAPTEPARLQAPEGAAEPPAEREPGERSPETPGGSPRGGGRRRPGGGSRSQNGTRDAKLPTFQTKRSGEVTIALEKGQDVIVQVTRESYASKGVRVSTKASLPGRFLVLLPLEPSIGISRKVQHTKERRRLRRIAKSILPEGYGCIIRTVAQDKDEEVIRQDLTKLIDTWREIEVKMKNTSSPALLYKDQSIANTVMRDLFTPDIDKVVIDNRTLYREIRDYVEWAAPGLTEKVELYAGEKPIFEAYGVEKEIEKMFHARVYLPSGGYIILEQTEAMMVIDVNSGRYASNKEQELNSLRTNLESAREIARQIRLRDIGGLIVVDFIDLYEEKNRKKVYDELKKEMRRDRAKSVVLPMTQFGLVQMTRQRIRQQLIQTISEPCPICSGSGLVQSKSTVVRKIERWLSRFKENSREFRLTLTANPVIIDYLTEGAMGRLTKLMLKYFVRIKVVPDESMPVDEFHFFSLRQQIDITEKFLVKE